MGTITTDQHTNRLARETSPYLLQHAHNPVDWHPWGEDAFRAAREQDKPIFLSVGYSTCYWCHVMERECFESEAIAQVMNEHVISIKVDREERPDVDDLYMTAVQLLTHSGGWPMSVFLEPHSLRPFVGGTYFPPDNRYGRPGFPTVLRHIAQLWSEQREGIERQAEQVAEAVREALVQRARPVPLGREHVDQAVSMLMRQYDPRNGGFSGTSGPKFPTPVNLDLLIGAAWDRNDVRSAILHTLDRMATGGIYDQVGGGFHRYSVDDKWLVPHFEKMLYDNAQLAATYSRAFELTGDAFYGRIVRETLDYVLREMTPGTHDDGGFFSAQDAEVHAREGRNYLWTATEVREALAAAGMSEDVDFTLKVYGFSGGANFRDPHYPEDGPKNVVYLIDRSDRLVQSLGTSLDDFNHRMEKINRALLKVRDERDQPGTDDKIIAGWNGLMIAGMADGGRVLGEGRYVEAARRAARFILDQMRRGDGSLLRTHRAGRSRIDAFAEDYAFLIRGLIALHRATGESEWLAGARELALLAHDRFWDDSTRGSGGGWFDTLADQGDLFVRTKGVYDGATPSANSVMLLNLLALHELTPKAQGRQYLDDAAAALRFLSATIAERPMVASLAVLGLAQILDTHPDAVATLAADDREEAAAIDETVRIAMEPESVVLGDEPVMTEVILEIADGYHLAARGDQAHFAPLSIEVDGEGLDVAVEYPPGERFGAAALGEDPLTAYTNRVRIPLRLRRVSGTAASARIIVSYQACSDCECLPPRRAVVPLKLLHPA